MFHTTMNVEKKNRQKEINIRRCIRKDTLKESCILGGCEVSEFHTSNARLWARSALSRRPVWFSDHEQIMYTG
jgi:hypothetical protein